MNRRTTGRGRTYGRASALAIATLVLIGTLLPATGAAAPPIGFAEYGGTIVMSYPQEPPTLNPFVPGGDNHVVRLIGEAYFTGAFTVDPTSGEILPEVTTRIPTVANGDVVVNGDGTMDVTYRIRPEAVWSDGAPITGDDFQFTFETVMRNDLPTSKEIYIDILATDATQTTFTATFSRPRVRYLEIFDILIPRHIVEGSDFLADWNTTTWAAGGPFTFAEWDFGNLLRLEANPNYWGTDPRTGAALPYVDEVIIRFIPDTLAEINGFRARETDVIFPEPVIDFLDTIARHERDGAELQAFGGPIWEHFNFQFGPNNRNADSLNEYLPFRQAIAHAIDREAIVDDILGGYGEVTQSVYGNYNPAYTTDPWAAYDHNPALAAEYLAEACDLAGRDCAADPPTVVFSSTRNNSARLRMAELIEPMLEAVGIDLVVELEDSQVWFGPTLTDGTWDFGEWAWLGGPNPWDAIEFLEYVDPDQPGPDGMNYYRWGSVDSSVITANSDRVAEIRDEIRRIADVDAVTMLLREAEQAMADDMLFLPLYRRLSAVAVWADEIAGVRAGPYNLYPTWNIGEWRRLDLDPVPAGLCDFNGDGIEDAAFGAPGETVGDAAGAGIVHVVMGRAGRGIVGRPDEQWSQDTTGIVNASETGDGFGGVLACGDFDGDEYGDLAIGVPGEGIGGVPGAGGVAVIHGSRTGLKANRDQFWHREQPSVRGTAGADHHFGAALAVGDFNGDGFDDLAVGIPGARFSGSDGAGVTQVFYGTADGLAATGLGGGVGDQLLNGTFGADAGYGSALAAGDLNGDGIDDLVVGAPGAASAFDQALTEAGGIEFVPGTTEGLNHGDGRTWTQDSPGILNAGERRDRFGAALAIGDFNGDHRLDLAIGAPGESIGGVFKAGMVHVLYSNESGPAASGNETLAEFTLPKSEFGASLAAGQLDGRRGDDLVVGVPGLDPPGAKDAGGIVVAFSGRNTVVGAGIDYFTQPEVPNKQDRFGASVRVADVNDDGYPDVIAGSPGERIAGNPGAGWVDAYLGESWGVSLAFARWRQGARNFGETPDPGDSFGAAIAG